MLGKVNVIDLQSQSPFFGGWGVEGFQNLALVVPPTGVTPLTLMAGSLSQQIGAVTLTAVVYHPSDRAQNTFQLSTTVLTPLQPERGVEMYYNLATTPWLSLTPDLQIIRPATAGAPLLTVLGLRTLLRF